MPVSIIHTVGPVWNGGTCGEQEKLASCYRNSLAGPGKNGVKRIAFPSLSPPVYTTSRWGWQQKTAIGTARGICGRVSGELEQILWVLFDAGQTGV